MSANKQKEAYSDKGFKAWLLTALNINLDLKDHARNDAKIYSLDIERTYSAYKRRINAV
jgi:hypothetical protein